MPAMTIVLFSIHQMKAVGVPNALLPQMLSSLIEYSSLPFYDITGKIMEDMERNGTGLCYDQYPNSTRVIGIPENVEVLTLSSNVMHKFWLQSYTKTRER